MVVGNRTLRRAKNVGFESANPRDITLYVHMSISYNENSR